MYVWFMNNTTKYFAAVEKVANGMNGNMSVWGAGLTKEHALEDAARMGRTNVEVVEIDADYYYQLVYAADPMWWV